MRCIPCAAVVLTFALVAAHAAGPVLAQTNGAGNPLGGAVQSDPGFDPSADATPAAEGEGTAGAASEDPAPTLDDIETPSAGTIIDTQIVPVLDNLADKALALQNAVLRHCLLGNEESRNALKPVYVDTVTASAALVPISFGWPDATNVPSRLLTQTSSTVFSRSRLEAVIQGRVPAPRTLEALAQEEMALMGLPALELLLMRDSYPESSKLTNRCSLAVPVAAHIVDLVARSRGRWVSRDIDPHWQGDDVELAERLRLRDLVQGMIDGVDSLLRDLSEFQKLDRGGDTFRFAQVRHGLPYLIASAEALRTHVGRLEPFAASDSAADMVLEEVMRALTVGCERLLGFAAGEPVNGGYVVAFEQAHGDIIHELPEAFGFAKTAFTRALTSVDVPRETSGAEDEQQE